MLTCCCSTPTGDRNEGWFDPWLLVRRLRNKAHVFGANYVVGEVKGFAFFKGLTRTHFLDRPKRAPLNAPRLSEVIVRTPSGGVEKIAFYTVVNCAGAWSGEIMKLAMAEVQEEVPPLPVQKRCAIGLCCTNFTLLIFSRGALGKTASICLKVHRKLVSHDHPLDLFICTLLENKIFSLCVRITPNLPRTSPVSTLQLFSIPPVLFFNVRAFQVTSLSA